MSRRSYIWKRKIIRITFQESGATAPQLFHYLHSSSVIRRENNAASHAENVRINRSTAIPCLDVILFPVGIQKPKKLFQLTTVFEPEIRKLTWKISRHQLHHIQAAATLPPFPSDVGPDIIHQPVKFAPAIAPDFRIQFACGDETKVYQREILPPFQWDCW